MASDSELLLAAAGGAATVVVPALLAVAVLAEALLVAGAAVEGAEEPKLNPPPPVVVDTVDGAAAGAGVGAAPNKDAPLLPLAPPPLPADGAGAGVPNVKPILFYCRWQGLLVVSRHHNASLV